MKTNIYLTQEQYDDLISEKQNILNVKLPKNAEDIAAAVAQGDLSENAEYENAKSEQGFLNKQLAEIENKLKYAKILKKSSKNDFVEIGHKVTIEFLENHQQETVTLMTFGNGINTISVDSALGQALLGKAVDETVTVDAPIGELLYKIISIE